MSGLTTTEIDVCPFRERILDVAEEYFRRIGHQKTSVEDIASGLGTSRGNIYRFFSSREAINKSVCNRFFAETVQVADGVTRMQAPAHDRLANLLKALHQKRKTAFIEEKPTHDLIVTALDKNWTIIRAHGEQIVAIIETLVREGIEAGEFSVEDAAPAARSTMIAFLPFYHPILVEQGVRSGEDTEARLLAQIGFISKALGART